MATKWLESALRRQEQNVVEAGERSNGVHLPEDRTPSEADAAPKVDPDDGVEALLEMQRRAREATDSGEGLQGLGLDENSLAMDKSAGEAEPIFETKRAPGGKATGNFQGDLMSTEDIYRAAGIMDPRMGYSITKVVEMINSDHLRGLSNDAKRAALLMALDAAGISVEEVLRDAAMRQNALDAYEADQRSLFEGNWTRKAEGNDQIQAEIGRLTAQYLERIKRNLDEVANEKTAFSRWQAMKQAEAKRISEAVGLCLKAASAEEADGSLGALQSKAQARVSAASRRKAMAERSEIID